MIKTTICVAIVLLLSFPKDSSVFVYRRGVNKVVTVRGQQKSYQSTPKRKIQYLYPVTEIRMINEKRGRINK